MDHLSSFPKYPLYDVIIIGGGPAGTTAARRCSMFGLNTLLLEKENYPREKVCGGAVSIYALSLLDFSLPSGIIENSIYGTTIHYGNQKLEVKSETVLAITTSRIKFDEYLMEKAKEAGACIKQGAKVIRISRINRDVMSVITEDGIFNGKLILGADGFFSKTAEYVRPTYKKNEYGICMVCHNHMDSKSKRICEKSETIDIYFDVAEGGYGWVFPHRDYYSIGVGGLANKTKNIKLILTSFLNRLGIDNKLKSKGFPIPAGGKNHKLVNDNIILIGDSAGFVDSFYGEGIAYAIKSGIIASKVAKDAIDKEDYRKTILNNYKRTCDNEFGLHLKFSAIFSKFMHSCPNILLRLLVQNESILEKYFEVANHQKSYIRFLAWFALKLPFFVIKKNKI